jgi:hypothetical protein
VRDIFTRIAALRLALVIRTLFFLYPPLLDVFSMGLRSGEISFGEIVCMPVCQIPARAALKSEIDSSHGPDRVGNHDCGNPLSIKIEFLLKEFEDCSGSTRAVAEFAVWARNLSATSFVFPHDRFHRRCCSTLGRCFVRCIEKEIQDRLQSLHQRRKRQPETSSTCQYGSTLGFVLIHQRSQSIIDRQAQSRVLSGFDMSTHPSLKQQITTRE